MGYRNLRAGRITPAKAIALVSALLGGIGLILGLQSRDLVEVMFSLPICVLLAGAYRRL
jgi:hypothetical protein